MIQNVAFVMEQYFLLVLLFVSLLGWGRLATAKLLATSNAIPGLSEVVLQATTGLGLVTIFSIFLSSIGALTAIPLLAIVIAGIVLFTPKLVKIVGGLNPGLDSIKIANFGLFPSMFVWVAAAAFVLHALIRPLALPLGWDEIAYHLPTAQAWAETGQLVVTDWLRYPLFPFNMQLLYAGALILGNDITTHLVHALTGFLTIALTFSVARVVMPMPFAVVASVCLFYAVKHTLLTADIDMGLMLYVFGAFVTLGFCYLQKRKSLVLLAAFFVGLALGTKYQAMFYLPALAATFLMVERDWKRLVLATVVVIFTGSFWYVRNFVISGDPIHPIGGSVFGYWLWNADDIVGQFADLQNARGRLPPWYLLISVGSFLFWRSSLPALKGCMAATFLAVLVWLIVSGYDRYLMPIYPMLAILSAYFLHKLVAMLDGYQISSRYWDKIGGKAQLTIAILISVAITYVYGQSAYKDIGKLVLPESLERTTFLTETYPGYALLSTVDGPLFGTVYQLGFENEIYYLGTPILGDHFGKARYSSVLLYEEKPAELSNHLSSLGAGYLLVNLAGYANFFDKTTADPSFSDYFELLGKTTKAVLYKVNEVERTPTPRVMRIRGKES